MTSEENKAIARRFLNAFVANDQATIEELLASDFVIHVPGAPDPLDRDFHVQGIGIFHAAFSDIDGTFEDQIAEGNKVTTRLTWRATQTGDFHGLVSTGKQFDVSAVDIMRIENGKIAERWFLQDELGMMQQLGALPTP